jgi:hypothetical protein
LRNNCAGNYRGFPLLPRLIFSVLTKLKSPLSQNSNNLKKNYVNNGEVNRKGFTFEEYIGDGLSLAAMEKILARRDFRKWAGL